LAQGALWNLKRMIKSPVIDDLKNTKFESKSTSIPHSIFKDGSCDVNLPQLIIVAEISFDDAVSHFS